MAETMSLPATQVSGQPTSSGIRKKFATPPVKIACLACRASRTRCDGGHPCSSCQSKARECVYKPSKRGGARVRRKPRPENDELKGQMIPSEPAEVLQEPIAIQNYIDPGAGLKQLGDWYQDSDFIFDSLFMSGLQTDYLDTNATMSVVETPAPAPVQPIPMVRTYRDDGAILEAYYIFIHPYFPILPPPSGIPLDNFVPRLQNHQPNEFDECGDYEPTSPIALAVSAVLALIPCANDSNHAAHESVLFRRGYAQFLAQAAVETIEAESEIPESSTLPQSVLSSEQSFSQDDFSDRPPFHPGLPRQLESIVALNILSVYEYAQRGNLKKMQSRAGQALVNSMALAIHENTEEDAFTEARRRVWWMTYMCVCQGAIVSNVQPTFAAFSPSFTAKFPSVQADPEAFAAYITAQQAILTATEFVIDLNKTMKANGDMNRVYNKMVELEARLEPLLAKSETWDLTSPVTLTIEPSEEVVGRSLRCMARIKLNSARIKLHRYCAFFDIPVFAAKHCDLKSKDSLAEELDQELRQLSSCTCSLFTSPPATGGSSSSTSSGGGGGGGGSGGSGSRSHHSSSSPRSDGGASGSVTSNTTTASSTTATPFTLFPFSSHTSAKICLRSALNIASDFDTLPYPNPSAMAAPPFGLADGAMVAGDSNVANGSVSNRLGGGATNGSHGAGAPVVPWLLSPTSTIPAPRTMPSFACCAMQCAYALLMVRQKTKTLNTYQQQQQTAYISNSGADGLDGSGAGGAPVAVPAGSGGQQPPGLVGNLVTRLNQGLMSILGTLDNYAVASEALGGMRDQIRNNAMGMDE
ncbi:C6 zinc finger domain-containing protein [Gaeumannomyces tritici R3-111a-1]|uniref:C6 zinc finger domain-containing protein n=1 Tax=Gaeumannomyces tritici (strain R3-111a-1) TaxID=644352 RepID=J3PGV9_GAET3|nr:C6 zinc finger domain-containing protein [Gaeumannomyces tritici R3-111a-1]EJT69856.1 C6 zinc finger domain-containing protein [Gaeumannomyces tritici R3-111a-1]